KVAKHEDWHTEHALIGNTREILVDLVINGTPVHQLTMAADGTPRPIAFTAPIAQLWLRHTPILFSCESAVSPFAPRDEARNGVEPAWTNCGRSSRRSCARLNERQPPRRSNTPATCMTRSFANAK